VLSLLIDGYSLLVLAAVILSWIQVSPTNPIKKVTDATVEPVLGQIRKVLPDLGGFDFSPWVLLIGLRLLQRLLLSGL
jgi:YggT family protein